MPTRRRSSNDFNPNSLNATLARIIAAQEAHGNEMRTCFAETREELRVIKEQVVRTNGRVNLLELWKETSKARLAGISAGLGAVGGVATWLAGILLK